MARDLSIADIGALADLNTSAIRYYERIGLLPAPERVNGRRRYSETVLRQLRFIDLAKRAGFSLDEIRTLVCSHAGGNSLSTRWRNAARGKSRELDAILAEVKAAQRLLANGMGCMCTSVENCPSCAEPTEVLPSAR